MRGISPFIKDDRFKGSLAVEAYKCKIGMLGKTVKTRKGAEMKLPVKLDHFVIVKPTRDASGNFEKAEEIHKIIGDKPKSLEISFQSNDPRDIWRTFFAYYTKTARYCYGDGEKAFRLNEKSGQYEEIECNIETCPLFEQGLCKPHGILTFTLRNVPLIASEAVVFRTTSANTIRAITAVLAHYFKITRGFIAGIPLKLVLRKKTQVDKNGHQREINYVSLHFDGTNDELVEEALKRANKMMALEKQWKEVRKVLPSTDIIEAETVEEIEAVAEEFHEPSKFEEGIEDVEEAKNVVQPTIKPDDDEATASADEVYIDGDISDTEDVSDDEEDEAW